MMDLENREMLGRECICVCSTVRVQFIVLCAQHCITASSAVTNGSGSCYFRQWPSRRQLKTNFSHNFFCLLIFEATFISFLKIKGHTSCHPHKSIQGNRFPNEFLSTASRSRWGSGQSNMNIWEKYWIIWRHDAIIIYEEVFVKFPSVVINWLGCC